MFTHYGMTETGFGGGVECDALDGYHLREGDIFFEVVDHETGQPCPEGAIGEVVITTLTRQGMPLIRYMTGDISRILSQPCPCGSVLKRMDRVRGRWDGAVHLGSDIILTLSDMDDTCSGYRVCSTTGPSFQWIRMEDTGCWSKYTDLKPVVSRPAMCLKHSMR